MDAGGGQPPPPLGAPHSSHVHQHSEKDGETLEISRVHLDALYSQLETLSNKVETLESSLGNDIRTILALLQDRPIGMIAQQCPAPAPGWIVGEVALIKGPEVSKTIIYRFIYMISKKKLLDS